MKLKAYAKINLFLEINGRRKNGYHNITSVFQRINLFDEIELKLINNKNIIVEVQGMDLGKQEDNLVYKAAKLLQDKYRVDKGVYIKLIKNIPIGAGLGGGSSDGAAVFNGLNKLWNLKLTCNQLMNLGKKIGADIPFFIQNKDTCLVKGIGERVQGLSLDLKFDLLLVYPNIKVSSGRIYKNYDLRLTKRRKNCTIWNLHNIRNGCVAWNQFLFNRLERPCFDLFPKLESLKNKLLSYNVEGVLMSGSGSSFYCFVSNKSEREKIKKDMELLGYTVWILKLK